ncbi:MAG TPA: VOC family protein, partial [Bacteroidia bacterium]|nr:VOC family protein [Bacteroidia bacterium]
MINHIEIILYVNDQELSKTFYQKLLRMEAALHVPGMTEFILSSSCKLGLMPNKGIAKILQDKTPHPDKGSGIPRCELYLSVDSVQ